MTEDERFTLVQDNQKVTKIHMHRNPEGPGFQFFNKSDDLILNFGVISAKPTII